MDDVLTEPAGPKPAKRSASYGKSAALLLTVGLVGLDGASAASPSPWSVRPGGGCTGRTPGAERRTSGEGPRSAGEPDSFELRHCYYPGTKVAQ